MGKPKFTIRSFLWLTLIVAAFFGGRESMRSVLRKSEARVEIERIRARDAEYHAFRSAAETADSRLQTQRLKAAIASGTAFPIRRVTAVLGNTLMLRPLFDDNEYRVRLYGVELPGSPPDYLATRDFIGHFCLGKDARVDERGKGSTGLFRVDITIDGKRLSAELLRAGLARRAKDCPDDVLESVEREARVAQRGIWGK